jgi:hypothetical protein
MQEYDLIVASPVWDLVDIIKEEIKGFSSADDADNWESGLFESLKSIKATPHLQESELETRRAGFSVRKFLYKQKDVNRPYHILYTIEEYPASLNGFSGMVKVIGIRHASRRPASSKELKEGLKGL